MATTYRVLKSNHVFRRTFLLGGREFSVGETFDESEFPDIPEFKWTQFREHRLLEREGVHDEVREQAVRRHQQEMARARAQEAADSGPVVEMPTGPAAALDDALAANDAALSACPEPDCDYVAKNPHGLKVHRGRRHKD